MKSILFTAVLVLAQLSWAGVRYNNQVELPDSATQIRITGAQYAMIPTKTEVREIPDCDPYSEYRPTCTETVVLETKPAIQVNISYVETRMPYEDQYNTTVILPLSAFSPEDVAALKAVYPAWKHPFTSVPRKFAKNKLALVVVKTKKDVQVVDARRSVLCPLDDNMNPPYGCVEKLVYKTAQSPVLVATVSVK